MSSESPRAALGAMARTAFDAGDLPLFDQATSERQLYDGAVMNAGVERQLARTYVYDCVLCGRWRCCIDANDRQAMKEQGYCAWCWNNDFKLARRRLRRYTDLTTGGHIQRSAAHWKGNEPMLERHRNHYRRCETVRRRLEAAFEALEV